MSHRAGQLGLQYLGNRIINTELCMNTEQASTQLDPVGTRCHPSRLLSPLSKSLKFEASAQLTAPTGFRICDLICMLLEIDRLFT